MAECAKCGADGSPFLYTCKFCSANVCAKHRLPENHECLPEAELETAREAHEKEPVRDPPRANHETCAECNNAVAPGNDLCPDCRYSPGDPDTEPVVTTSTGTDGESTGSGIEWQDIRYRIETSWLRTRSWASLLILLFVVFGGLFTGTYLLLTRQPAYFGVTVPEIVVGSVVFQPPRVAALSGICVMLLSFSVGLKAT